MKKEDIKKVNDWINWPDRVKGCSKKQIDIIRDYKRLLSELARTSTLTYFLLNNLDIKNCRTMMTSSNNQRDFVFAAYINLKEYRLDPEFYSMFRRNAESLQRRVDHIFRICKENLRLTEYYPYFEENGFDMLLDFRTEFFNDGRTPLDGILPDIEKWNSEHQDLIKAHMEKIQPEIDAMNAHKQMLHDKAMAEKKAAAEERKKERELKKEIKAFHKKEDKRDKAIERSLNHAYIEAAKHPYGYNY